MKKTLLGALAASLLLALPALAKPLRITFRKGATRAVAQGRLDGYRDRREFVVRLRAGQTLTVSSDRSITLAIVDPSGADVTDRDLGCNGRKRVAPTVAGDYRIVVVECAKTDPWRGRFRLFVAAK